MMEKDNIITKRIKNEFTNLNDEIGICAVDLHDNTISYKENEQFETGSAIKSFIVLEYYKQILENKIKREDKLVYKEIDKTLGAGILKNLEPEIELSSKNLLVLMIIISDNIATNLIIDYLGLENINKTIKEYGFSKTKLYSKIDLTKYNKVGITTPHEYAMLFKGFATNQYFEENISKEIIEIFKMQKYNSVLTKYIPKQYFDKKEENNIVKYVASKSGKMSGKIFDIPTDTIINDGGIVSTTYGEYIVSIFSKEKYDVNRIKEFEIADVCSKISAIILNEFLSNKGRFKE